MRTSPSLKRARGVMTSLLADDDEEGGEFSIPQLELEIAVEVKGQGWRSYSVSP